LQLFKVEIVAAEVATMFRSMLAAGGFDENPAHGFGGGGEEMSAAIPSIIVAPADQPEVRFVNQGGGLKGLAGRFGGHTNGGKLPQLVVDEREQVGSSLAVTRCGGFQELSHVGHSDNLTCIYCRAKHGSWLRNPAAGHIDRSIKASQVGRD
jgi:hypothetical protein